jgi:hypothetical protein
VSFDGFPRRPRSRWELAHPVRDRDECPERELVADLASAGLLTAYERAAVSSPASPSDVGELGALRKHGVALCLHSDEQREADLPSSWLFEAAASGAVIIADELPFARRVLGDAALYVDTTASRPEVFEAIAGHLRALNENPDQGERLAASAYARLSDGFDLEGMVARTCDFAQEAIRGTRRSRQQAVQALQAPQARPSWSEEVPAAEHPLIDVIVRAGGRAPNIAIRALRSIARQEAGSYRVILVDYKGSAELKRFAETFRARNTSVTYVRSSDTGYRSTSLWTGLAHVEAPFFAILDDDDTVAPEHFPSLLELARGDPACGFFYGGTIRVEDEGAVAPPPNFIGPLKLPFSERRELKFLEPHDLSRLIALDNYITSSSFIARRELLDEAVLADPELEVAEDVYLYLLLAARTSFRSTFRPTAHWHWRSRSRDNSMLGTDAERWRRAISKVSQRLEHIQFPAVAPFSKLRGEEPFVLELGNLASFDAGLVARSEHSGLHEGEPEGVWSKTTRSFVRLLLRDFVQEGRVLLEFAAAGAPNERPQQVRIAIDDHTIHCGPVPAWDRIRLEKPIGFAFGRNVVILRVECDRTVCPAGIGAGSTDERELGVLLSKIRIDALPLRLGPAEAYSDSDCSSRDPGRRQGEVGADGRTRA